MDLIQQFSNKYKKDEAPSLQCGRYRACAHPC